MTTNEKRIKILSYNTHLFHESGGKLAPVWADELRRNKIADYLRECDYDVVCLCEVWTNSDRDYFREKSGFKYGYYKSTHALNQGDGLIILSRYPIYFPSLVTYDRPSIKDVLRVKDEYLSNKGFIKACIKVDDTFSFRVFFTHTQADDDKCDIRESQFRQIQADLHNFYPELPAIVLGDLNVPAVDGSGNTDEYEKLIKNFDTLKDTAAIFDADNPGNTCDPEKNVLAKKFKQTYPARYDYILSSKQGWKVDNIEVLTQWTITLNHDPDGQVLSMIDPDRINIGNSRAFTVPCSDHYPLLATLTLTEPASFAVPVYDSRTDAYEAAKRMCASSSASTANVITIDNNSEYTLELLGDFTIHGEFRNTAPAIIPPGKSAAALHINTPWGMEDSEGGFIMRVAGMDADLLCIFIARYALTSKNRIFVAIRPKDNWKLPADEHLRKHFDGLAENDGKKNYMNDTRECAVLANPETKVNFMLECSQETSSITHNVFVFRHA